MLKNISRVVTQFSSCIELGRFIQQSNGYKNFYKNNNHKMLRQHISHETNVVCRFLLKIVNFGVIFGCHRTLANERARLKRWKENQCRSFQKIKIKQILELYKYGFNSSSRIFLFSCFVTTNCFTEVSIQRFWVDKS